MSWDNQNRLIESKVNKGVAELFVVPSTWKNSLNNGWQYHRNLKSSQDRRQRSRKLADQFQVLASSQKTNPISSPTRTIFGYSTWLLIKRAKELTHTPDQKEDEALLSPDNKQVAYLKGNDMYVTDVATAKETRLTTDGSETVFNGRLIGCIKKRSMVR